MKEFFKKIKNNFKNKKTTILICIILFLIILFFTGMIYGWSQGTTKKVEEIDASTGNEYLKMYFPLLIDYSKLQPGWTDTKDFYVQNNSSKSITYAIIWKEITNSYTRTGDITLSIKSTNDGGNTDNEVVPNTGTNVNILSDITIGPKSIQKYKIIFNYKKLDKTDQTIDYNKSLTGIISVISIN